jgi:hypothetical protein
LTASGKQTIEIALGDKTYRAALLFASEYSRIVAIARETNEAAKTKDVFLLMDLGEKQIRVQVEVLASCIQRAGQSMKAEEIAGLAAPNEITSAVCSLIRASCDPLKSFEVITGARAN